LVKIVFVTIGVNKCVCFREKTSNKI